jgi:hypothetical protein
LPFEVANARLVRVVVNNFRDRGRLPLALPGFESVFLELPFHDVMAGNLQLLMFRVARNVDDFHPVS